MNKPGKTLVVLLAALILAACGSSNGISGTYTNKNGMSIKFESGKAYMTSFIGTTTESDYTVDGDKIILKMSGGPGMVLTRNKDGSIGGYPGGDLEKTGNSGLSANSHLSGDYGIMHDNSWYTLFTFHGNRVEIHAPGSPSGTGSVSGTYEIRGHKVYITAKGDNGKDATHTLEIDDKGCLVFPKSLEPNNAKSIGMPHLCKKS